MSKSEGNINEGLSRDRYKSGAESQYKVSHIRPAGKPRILRQNTTTIATPVDWTKDWFSTRISHKPSAAVSQVQGGLETVKQVAEYMKRMTEAMKPPPVPLEGWPLPTPVLAKDDNMLGLRAPLTDLCFAIATAHKRYESFVNGVKGLISPLTGFHQISVEAVNGLAKLCYDTEKELETVYTALEVERSACLKALYDLKALEAASVVREASKDKKKASFKDKFISSTSTIIKYAGASKQDLKQKTEVAAKFAKYEESYGKVCSVYNLAAGNTLPHVLSHLDQIETDRVRLLNDTFRRFGRFQLALLGAPVSVETLPPPMTPVLDRIDLGMVMGSFLHEWRKTYGLPPEDDCVKYGLPCRQEDIMTGDYDALEKDQCCCMVSVERALGLRAADSNGLSDPYCVVKVVDTSHDKEKVIAQLRSPIVYKSLDPVWDFTATFDNNFNVQCALENNAQHNLQLLIEVYDDDGALGKIRKDDFLGELSRKFTDFEEGDTQVKSYPLQSNPAKQKIDCTGSVFVALHFQSKNWLAWKKIFQFGRPLALLACKPVEPFAHPIPIVLLTMQQYLIEHNGLKSEGIFRLAPVKAEAVEVVWQLKTSVFHGQDSNGQPWDVNAVANSIKLWFRDLPQSERILDPNFQSTETVLDVDEEAMMRDKLTARLRVYKEVASPSEAGAVIAGFPMSQQKDIFFWLLDLMVSTLGHQDALPPGKQMTPKSLAIVFGPNLIPVSISKPQQTETEAAQEFAMTCDAINSFVEQCILWRSRQDNDRESM